MHGTRHAPSCPSCRRRRGAPPDLSGYEAHVGNRGAHQVEDVVGLFFLGREAQVGVEAPAEVDDAVLPEELGALWRGVVEWRVVAELSDGVVLSLLLD